MRLIDADALKKAINEWMPKDQETWTESEIPPIENLVVSIMLTIEEQPTVDALPHIEKTGKWLRLNDDKSVLGCSACGKWACLSNYINEGEKDGQFKSPYCPYCGAKMDE